MGKAKPLKVFICYAREDAEFSRQLKKHLAPLKERGLIQEFLDTHIHSGEEWDNKIKEKLVEADIFLPLLSSDLYDSEYIRKVEIPYARKHKINGGLLVCPVKAREVHIKETWLAGFQCIPHDCWVTDPKADEIWAKVVSELDEQITIIAGQTAGTENDLEWNELAGQAAEPEFDLRWNKFAKMLRHDLMAASNITLVSRTGVGWFSDFPLEMLPFISGRMEGAAKIIVLDPDSSIFYNDTFRYFQPVSKEKNIEGAWAVENNQRQAVVKRFLENVNGANVGVLNETLNTIWLIECAGGNKIVYVELGGNKQYQEGVYRKLASTPEDKDLSKPLANHILQINELWERADKNKYPCRN